MSTNHMKTEEELTPKMSCANYTSDSVHCRRQCFFYGPTIIRNLQKVMSHCLINPLYPVCTVHAEARSTKLLNTLFQKQSVLSPLLYLFSYYEFWTCLCKSKTQEKDTHWEIRLEGCINMIVVYVYAFLKRYVISNVEYMDCCYYGFT